MHVKDEYSGLKIIAVDFDGTLCENQWPEIGPPNDEVIRYILEEQKLGAKLILWTNRSSVELLAARRWSEEHGIVFDAVNENLPEIIEAFGGRDTRKVYADEYIDDRANTRFNLPYISSETRQNRFVYTLGSWLNEFSKGAASGVDYGKKE